MEYLHTDKVIVLVDMDCFYCQVEEKLNPHLVGKPIAVVQYNAWRGGGIIAVNYPAKDKGVTRHMRGNEAKAKCPDINLVSVPTLREKADLTKYRNAGKEVAAVLQIYADVLERASVDEAYLDITETVNTRIKNGYAITIGHLKNTHVVGTHVKDFIDNIKEEHFLESNLKLCIGGIIAEEVRAAVFKKTGYKCSAGIAHNKILAKLACGLHKPNQQTILPQDGVDKLFETLPLRKIRSLGGKFGSNLEDDLGIKMMGELKKFTEKDLISRYDEKTGSWLYKIARGIDLEPVTERLVSKSIGCCKKFPGRTALIKPEDVHHWINELSIEISERLQNDFEENNRKAKQIVVGFAQKIGNREVSTSRAHPLSSYEPEKIATDMLKVINKHCPNTNGYYHITYLGVSAGKFEDCKKNYDITAFFTNSNKQIDFSGINKNSKTLGVNVNPTCNTTITSETEVLKYCNDKPKDLSNQTKELEPGTSITLNRTVSNYSCHNEQDVLDTNDNYLNDSKFSKSNIVNLSEMLCSDTSDPDSIIPEVENTESSDVDSIFSQNTDVIDFDETGLVFNDDYKSTEGFYRNPLLLCEESRSSETDSITDEIKAGCVKSHDLPEQSTSYFSNYFNNRECFNRNFDTSRYLGNDFESESTSTDNLEKKSDTSDDTSFRRPSESPNYLDPSKYMKENKSPNVSGTQMEIYANINEVDASTSDEINYTNNINYSKPFEAAFDDDTRERCKECNKLIPKIEMTSHMDYHYAIQIVRDEAHLYSSQNNVSVVNSKKQTVTIKQNKRKKCEMASNMLKSYLENSKEIPSNISTETCPHCNKEIPTNEFLSHVDYHVAKNLQSEINLTLNSNDKTPCHDVKTRMITKTVRKKQLVKPNKRKSVMSFFKQNM